MFQFVFNVDERLIILCIDILSAISFSLAIRSNCSDLSSSIFNLFRVLTSFILLSILPSLDTATGQ